MGVNARGFVCLMNTVYKRRFKVSEKTPKKTTTPASASGRPAQAARTRKAPESRPAAERPRPSNAGPARVSGQRRSSQWEGSRERMSKGRFALAALAGAGLMAVMFLAQMGLGGADTAESPLKISEVMTGNVAAMVIEDGSAPDWIEIENTSEKAVSLSGWGLMRESDPTDIFTFGSQVIEPGEYVLVYADSNTSLGTSHAPFRLSSSGGNIALFDRSGRGVDLAEVPELKDDQSYARDVAGKWQITDTPTPGEVNNITKPEETAEGETVIKVVPGAIEISEIMSGSVTWFADGSGQCHDYIELHNTSGQDVSLGGWYLTDSKERLTRWQFPDVTIPANGYLAVHCSGQDKTDSAGRIHTSFKLSSDGDTVVLTDRGGTTVSMAEVPLLNADQAWSRTATGWTKTLTPTPGAANTLEASAATANEVRERTGTGVYITEMLASSSKSSDWVEIFNGSGQAVDISGWGLSDNANRPRKWQFPEGTRIQPGQYIGVYCDGMDTTSGGNMHSSFALAAEGGYSLVLSDPEGNILDRMFVPQQYANMSYGRMEGYREMRYFRTVTPGEVNSGTTYLGRASSPEYSVRGGLFRTGNVFNVELKAEPGQKIYYTLDNTDPDENSTPYTGPITVSETTILRTRVYGSDRLESYMDTQSYLFDVNNGGGTVYTVSLVSDPYNLTSDEAGIMVKGPNALKNYPYGSMGRGANFWMDWEREAHVEIFNPDGSTMLSQECGIKLHGQYSRAEDQKAFKVIARSEYGDSRFNAPIFSNRDYTEYQSFLLRASGQDTDKTRMRDSILSGLGAGTSVLYQETEVCVVYLDGKYWGHYNLRERINPACIAQFEGWEGDEDSIDLIKANSNIMQGSNSHYEKLLEWVKKTNMNTDEAYETLGKAIDIQNYIEYMAIQMYTGNTDTLNVKRYRNKNADGKWRWVIFDLDWAFYTDTNSVTRWLTPGGMGNGNRTDNTLFIACMKNDTFRDQFLTHLGQRMATDFSAESLLGKFEERYEVLKPILGDHIERWKLSESTLNTELKRIISYTKERPKRMFQFLKYCPYLKLSQNEMQKYFGDAMEVHGVTYDKIKKA